MALKVTYRLLPININVICVGNPITKLCKALGETLYSTSNDCALYDIDGKKIADEIDVAMEKVPIIKEIFL